VKQARIQGLETTLQFRWTHLAAALSGTLPRAFDRADGRKLTDAGTSRASLDLTVPIRRVIPQGALSLRVRWNDAVTGEDSTLARPAFTSTSLELSSVFAGTRAAFAVRNLGNLGYREPLSFIPESGRTYALSLRRNFDFPLPFAGRRNP
jgi:outer membrane cobalamin receptor